MRFSVLGSSPLGPALVLLGGLLGCGMTDVGQPAVRAECADDGDCAAGYYCHAIGVCTPRCEVDAECSLTEGCTDGRCVALSFGDCAYPCPGGMQCVAAQCRWDCTTSDDCPLELTCQGESCAEPRCMDDENCGSLTVCYEGQCLSDVCRENAECASDSICLRGDCVQLGQCFEDVHCQPGQTCDAAECVGEPLPSEDLSGDPCQVNNDCPERQYCVAGTCRFSTECLEHAHCSAGQACFRTFCWEAR